MGSPRLAPSNRLRRVDDRFKLFQANKAAYASRTTTSHGTESASAGVSSGRWLSTSRDDPGQGTGTPAPRTRWGGPWKAAPNAPPSQTVRGIRAPNTFLQKGLKRQKEQEMGKQLAHARVWTWQAAGCGDTPAPLGAARGSGTVAPAPGAGGGKQPALPGALPDHAPPRTREINITAVWLPASGQKQPTERAANVTAMSQCATHGSKWWLIPSVPMSLRSPCWSLRWSEAATPWSGHAVLTGRCPVFRPWERNTIPSSHSGLLKHFYRRDLRESGQSRSWASRPSFSITHRR